MDHLNTPSQILPLADRCFSMYEQSDPLQSRTFYLDLSLIELEISRPSRFACSAVVVVDYDMPMMNGLEFCQQIKDKKVQRILLTGVANEQVAIQAFNAGLIDRFVRKNDDHALGTIFRYIDELQKNYFAQMVDKLNVSFTMQPPEHLQDGKVHEFVTNILTNQTTLEYYLVSEPIGYLLVNSGGGVKRLIWQNSDHILSNIDYAQVHGAPEGIVEELKNVKSLAFFYQQYDAHSVESYPWEDFIFQAQHIEGSSWYAAFVDNPPLDIEYDPGRASYNSYLRSLDDATSN